MFGGSFTENSQKVISLDETPLTVKSLNIILDAIYSEKLQLTTANIEDVTAAADFFRLENVILVCDKFLSENGNFSVLTPGWMLSL